MTGSAGNDIDPRRRSRSRARPTRAQAKGATIVDVARSLRVSEVALNRWRAAHGAVDRDAAAPGD